MYHYKHWVLLSVVLLLFFLPACSASNIQKINDQDLVEEAVTGENEDVQDVEEQEEQGGQLKEVIRTDIELKITSDSLAMRKTPGTKNKETDDILVRLKKDQPIYLQDKHENQIRVDGYLWWEIYDPSSQTKGWCASKFLISLDTENMGTIEGSITFPAGEIPEGFVVVVEDVVTDQEYITDVILYDSKYRFGVGFAINVPPGNYYVYAIEPNARDFKAYYDEYMQSGMVIDSYEEIIVPINLGQHVQDIFVGNWWKEGYP